MNMGLEPLQEPDGSQWSFWVLLGHMDFMLNIVIGL